MRVREAWPRDLEACRGLDGSGTTDHVWQMETQVSAGRVTTVFRLAPLPREIALTDGRDPIDSVKSWQRSDGFLVAVAGAKPIGFVSLMSQVELGVLWVKDLVVDRAWRRQGIGSSLLRAAGDWGLKRDLVELVMSANTRNYPAICFCQSSGLSYSGYRDHSGRNQDIVLYFSGPLR
jgi:GNAT superfamily N-acetyltransferase